MRAYFEQMEKKGTVKRGDITFLHVLPNDILGDLLFDYEDV